MYNANYMDGVPVKIAEKYKPPPDIYKLPQTLTNKINLGGNFYQNCPSFSYDLQLEEKALSKIEQWKRIRQRNMELRRERLSKREEQRMLENENRQKNLLYSVSYPSTDDLSSGGEDEEGDANGDIERKKSSVAIEESAPHICVTETANSFHNILQPTVLSYESNSINSNSTLTPLLKTTFDVKLSNAFNYKDFEDDTSSPFDNIELKTINDLDVLAQVLHNTQIKSQGDAKFDDSAATVSVDSNDCETEQQHGHTEAPLSHTTENNPKPNNNLPIFSYDFNSTQGALTQLGDHHTISAIQYNANIPTNVSPQQQHQQYNNVLSNLNDYYSQGLNSICSNNSNNCNIQNTLDVEKHIKCDRLQVVKDDQMIKSKSVPDILKELRDEIRNSEIRRYRNCSYNMEESTKNIETCLTNNAISRINDATDNSDTIRQLDCKSMQLIEQISAMGFPQKRVTRIVQLVGADDKKVIEHLIPLSELVDLGFDESKISEALIRNQNNKNKALDDLIL